MMVILKRLFLILSGIKKNVEDCNFTKVVLTMCMGDKDNG